MLHTVFISASFETNALSYSFKVIFLILCILSYIVVASLYTLLLSEAAKPQMTWNTFMLWISMLFECNKNWFYYKQVSILYFCLLYVGMFVYIQLHV